MNRMRLLFLLFAALLPASGYACSCARPSSHNDRELAEGYAKQATVIFEGSVESVRLTSAVLEAPFDTPVPAVMVFPNAAVTVKVSRTYRGDLKGKVVISTGIGGADCSFWFGVGRTYLVYGYMFQNKIYTSVCSGTNEVTAAGAALRFLRKEAAEPEDLADSNQKPQPSSYGVICGTLRLPRNPASTWGVTAIPEGEFPIDEVRDTRVDSNGHFCIKQVSPGTYQIRAFQQKDGDLYASWFYPGVPEQSAAKAVTVGPNGGVNNVDFAVSDVRTVSIEGNVKGLKSLFNPGEPPTVYLMTASHDGTLGWSPQRAVTIDPGTGNFRFENVASAKYQLFLAIESTDFPKNIPPEGWRTRKLAIDATTDLHNIELELIPPG